MTHRFFIEVDCSMFAVNPRIEEVYSDNGFIILPENYSEGGAPTGLVINCHGAVVHCGIRVRRTI